VVDRCAYLIYGERPHRLVRRDHCAIGSVLDTRGDVSYRQLDHAVMGLDFQFGWSGDTQLIAQGLGHDESTNRVYGNPHANRLPRQVDAVSAIGGGGLAWC
jgi:hypothetical protein